MKKRVITGAVYVAICIALLALKWLFYLLPADYAEYGALGFDVLFTAVASISCFEFLRAFGGVSYPQKALTIAFCAATVPAFAIIELTVGSGLLGVAELFCVYLAVQALLCVFDHARSTVRGAAVSVLSMIYCGLLPSLFAAVNHISDNSVLAILTLFVCTMLTDSGAFFFGILFKRFLPAKLAPNLSPNKTVIGAVGGLVGGIAGAVISYYVYLGIGGAIGTPVVYGSVLPAVVFCIIAGLLISIAVQAGDLFESAVKRECGVKDMGNLLPGHGGVLDRFDGMLFAGVVTFVLFGVLVPAL